MMEILQQGVEGVWNASWRASLLVGMVLAAQLVFGRFLTAKWRHALWLVVVVRLALPVGPGSSWSVFNLVKERVGKLELSPSPSGSYNEMRTVLLAPDLSESTTGDFRALGGALPQARDEAPVLPKVATRGFYVAPGTVLVLGWAVGAILFGLCAVANSFFLFRRMQRLQRVQDASAWELLEECKQLIGARGRVELLEAPAGTSPAVFGLWRARLLIPSMAMNRFSREELRFIFLHELAHVKRRDVAWNWVMMVLQMAHWFNPVIWFAFARMRADRELACDAMALECAGAANKQSYGETIIRLLETFARPVAAPNLLGILENKRQMRRRLEMIARFRKATPWSALAMILLLGLGCVGLTDAPKVENSAAPQKSKPLDPKRLAKQRELFQRLGKIRVKEFPMPSEKSLFVTLAELKSIAQQAGPKKEKINFHVAAAVTNFSVKFDPPIRDVTLKQFLDALVMVAKPPKDRPDASLKYTIQGDEILFSERARDAQRFYTRTYRVDPNAFRRGLEGMFFSANPFQGLVVQNSGVTAKPQTTTGLEGFFSFGGTNQNGKGITLMTVVTNSSTIQNEMRAFFAAAGVDFPTNSAGLHSLGQPGQPAPKAMFFNERAGVLFVRAPRRDLDIIEQALHVLNTTPPQVILMMHAIEFSDEDMKLLGVDGLLGGMLRTNMALTLHPGIKSGPFTSVFTGILKAPQFRQLLHDAENKTGVDVIKAPSITTISGRQARLSIEESGKQLSPQTPPPRPRSTAPDANPTPAEDEKRTN